LPDLAWWEVVIRIAVAAGLGGAIGIERELHEREAGFRTHLLVSVGAALFTLVSAYAWRDFQFGNGVSFDPTRIAAQIVTGIGFLGAGAIIRQGLSVRGLTTAATLWVVAAIGMASGAGYYTAAVITTVAALVTLWPLRIFARSVLDKPQARRLAVDLVHGRSAGGVLDELDRAGVRVESFSVEEEDERRRVQIVLDLPRGASPGAVVSRLATLEDVRGVQWNP
jgi:putative Mg2+ transporter-C (MgtC) family protein